MPRSENDEKKTAVRIFHALDKILGSVKSIPSDLFSPSKRRNKWPAIKGNYKVGNPRGEVAVCVLTTGKLTVPVSQLDNVAIAGRLYTPNLGIEKIALNVVSNPHIRYLILCGKDSPVFHAGQAIQSLFKYGVDSERRIINATGHYPVLQNVGADTIRLFTEQVELVDMREESDLVTLRRKIFELSRLKKEPFAPAEPGVVRDGSNYEEGFLKLIPGGKRIPLDYDESGFFVITADADKNQIVVRHYHKDNKPGYIIRGHSAESILIAVLEKDLLSEMSHAGYLGAELAKAETAIRLKLIYEQDQPLRSPG